MDMCAVLDMCGICVGYVWNGYVWDMCAVLDMCGICVGYVWNGYVWDMCGVLDMCGICVGYVWNGYVWDMCGVLDMCGICVGYVWNGMCVWDTFGMDMCGICVGYVWNGYVWDTFGIDMCGVRYANNLLKNPATKRLSGTTICWDETPKNKSLSQMAKTRNFVPQKVGSTAVLQGSGLANDRRNTIGLSCSLEGKPTLRWKCQILVV